MISSKSWSPDYTSLGGRYSVSRGENFISGKTKSKIAEVYRSRRPNRKIKAVCGKYSYELMGMWFVSAMEDTD